MFTLKLDYKKNRSDLCEIGRKYDTDKSSQRDNVTDYRHCHPYTLFYESLFKHKKNECIDIAELGILEGSSLLMLHEYFKNANIFGFEYNYNLINKFIQNHNKDRITLSSIDVTNKEIIKTSFGYLNIKYDIIIEDTTHQFEDQINVIESVYPYLKPGGILIIEDIFKKYNEQNYLKRLAPILSEFQEYYFVELDHERKNSTGWDNDKLFILVKKGEPIFKQENKMTIITPSYRTNNLMKLKESIDFDYVDEWIIVYDGSKIVENPNLFHEEKIKEYVFKGDGISGNPQRNFALSHVTNPNTMLYYLDDDNTIHPSLYHLLDIVDNTKMYTFNQKDRIKGNEIEIYKIDSAMCLIPYSLCSDVRWKLDLYEADGHYIKGCYQKVPNIHIYVDNDLCYYNKLT